MKYFLKQLSMQKIHDEQIVETLNKDGRAPCAWLIWFHSPHPNLGPSVLIQWSLKFHTQEPPFFIARAAIKMQISQGQQHNKSHRIISQCSLQNVFKKKKKQAGKRTGDHWHWVFRGQTASETQQVKAISVTDGPRLKPLTGFGFLLKI